MINSTGVWTEETEALSGERGGLRVLASKGIHIVVPRDRIRGEVGLILQTEKSVLFFIPWSRYWLIGTTDTPWTQELQHPVATSADIEYVLKHANTVLARPLTRDDIIGTWAGLRPLLQPGTKAGTSSAKISREHTTASPVPGLTVIAGGKLTTYRVMATDAVDFALGDRAKDLPSITERIPLVGAVGLEALGRRATVVARTYGWNGHMVDHLLHRYGSLLGDLVDAIAARPDLARPLEHAPAYLRAEIVYAATHEGVLHLEDVMLHRTRLNYEMRDRGLAALPEIAALVGEVLGLGRAAHGRGDRELHRAGPGGGGRRARAGRLHRGEGAPAHARRDAPAGPHDPLIRTGSIELRSTGSATPGTARACGDRGQVLRCRAWDQGWNRRTVASS